MRPKSKHHKPKNISKDVSNTVVAMVLVAVILVSVISMGTYIYTERIPLSQESKSTMVEPTVQPTSNAVNAQLGLTIILPPQSTTP